MLLIGTAQAQDGVYRFAGMNEVEAVFASQQQELDSLRAELASLRTTSGDDKVASGDCCGNGSGWEGGLRGGEIDWSGEDGGTRRFGFDGIGPTLGLQASRPVFGGLAAVAGIRHSALFGNTKVRTLDAHAERGQTRPSLTVTSFG